jgi:DNA-binding response OmpR family regulator
MAVVAKNQDFVMVFPARNIEDYILLDSTGPEMSNFTVLSWINTSAKETVALFTYSDGSDEEIRITFNSVTVYFRVHKIAA